MGVVEHLHDLNFSVDLLQVHSVQLCLVDDLDGHLQNDGAVSFSITYIRLIVSSHQTWQYERPPHTHTNRKYRKLFNILQVAGGYSVLFSAVRAENSF